MTITIKRNDLIVLNDLVQVSSAISASRIDRYVIQANKEEKAIIVEKYQNAGRFGVLLRKELAGIRKDDLIPISDAKKLGEYLNIIADDEDIKISIDKNIVLFEHDTGKLKLASYEEDEREVESRERIRGAFETLNYGNDDNKLTYYKKEDESDPDPDAICKLDLKRLKLKSISSVFKKISYVTLKANDGKFYINAKEGKVTEVERTIEKGEKDAMSIEGDCEILLQDLDCINMLAQFDGTTIIEMKPLFPLVLKKKLPDNRIGINYIVSLTEIVEEQEEEEAQEE